MSLRIRRISTYSDLASLREPWNQLACSSPFCCWQWLRTWAESYIKSEQLYTLVAETHEGEVVGILPLYRDISRVEGRTLRWLGSGSVHSQHMSLIVSESYLALVVQSMTEWLASMVTDSVDGWDSMMLDGVQRDDRNVHAIANELEQFGVRVSESPSRLCWRITLPESWDHYLASLSSDNRDQINELLESRLNSCRVRLSTVTSDAEFQPALERLIALHQRYRYELGEPGRFISGQFTRFLSTAGRRMLADGAIQLHEIELDGRAIAATLLLQQGPTMFAYESGIDPKAAAWDPAQMLMAATIQASIDCGARHLDFLGGNEPDKDCFEAEPIHNVTVQLHAPTSRNTVFHSLAHTIEPTMNRLPRPIRLSQNARQDGRQDEQLMDLSR